MSGVRWLEVTAERMIAAPTETSWAAFWSPIVNDWVFLDSRNDGYVVFTVPNPLDDFPIATLKAFVPNNVGEMEEVPGVMTAVGEWTLENGSIWRASIDMRGVGMHQCHLRKVEVRPGGIDHALEN